MNKTITFFAKDLDKKMRLDKYLTKNLKTFTRSQIKKIILSKNIKLNNKFVVTASEKVNQNDLIEVNFPEEKTDDISDQSLRRVAGIRNSERTLTWSALQNRRNEAIERLPVRSVVEEIS